jgi:hydroxymethylbilane synthase
MIKNFPKIRIGTRGSPLAMAQAHETQAKLMAAHGLAADAIELISFATTGDQITNVPLAEIGGKGLFTKELEEALLAGTIDLAVHSMKDMPAKMPHGLDVVALLEREDPRDAFISFAAQNLRDLPFGALLGSSSVRRTAQALRLRPDLKTVGFRGNVQTRLRKLQEGVAQATFLACAGLNRLGYSDKITAVMSMDEMLPAIAQGAIGIQIAVHNKLMIEVIEPLNHQATAIAVHCERGFMAALDGSCKTPIAGHASIEGDDIIFRGEALTLDGQHVFTTSRRGPLADAVAMGQDAGEELKRRGGKLIAY